MIEEKKILKVLNLYAGIGGNRKLWTDVQVTAVELNPEIAKIYQDFFPEDTVIVADAHQYLLDHYKEFDFIWSSPPCPSHSRLNTFLVPIGNRNIEYPDMRLYQEIILLKNWFKGKWVIENVIPYYDLLIPGTLIDRHIFWSNFTIIPFTLDDTIVMKASDWRSIQVVYGYDLSEYKFKDKTKILRNCVHPETGQRILEQARGIIREENVTQTKLAI